MPAEGFRGPCEGEVQEDGKSSQTASVRPQEACPIKDTLGEKGEASAGPISRDLAISAGRDEPTQEPPQWSR